MNDELNIFELYKEGVEQSQMHVDSQGDRVWTLHGKFHRIGAPAIEYADGNKEWWVNDRLHRIDGPAIELEDGYKAWFLNGKRHNTDGPAIEDPDGHKSWWVNNEWFEDAYSWAKAALKYEGKEPTKEMIEQKIAQVMQQDLFS